MNKWQGKMLAPIDFDKFSRLMGFETYPFNSYTAENEREIQAKLFISTKLYSPLFEAFDAGQTMILCGDRGTGKTAITYDFVRRASNTTLVVSIDDFSALAVNYANVGFYKFMISGLVNRFFSASENSSIARKRLSEEERIVLTYFYQHFADDAVKGMTRRKARELQVPLWKKSGIYIYGFFRHPMNFAANFGASLVADIVSRSLGSTNIDTQVREYFPEIHAGVEADMPRDESTLSALRQLCQIIKKCGYSRIIFIFDKVDEDQRLENAAEEISEFLQPIVTNNAFLLDENFQTILSTWVVPINFIRDKIRTQKIHTPEIKWQFEDLKRVYDRRVEVYSDGQAKTFDDAFSPEVPEALVENILDLSNRNPRDLWHLMDKIFRSQYRQDATSTLLTEEAVRKGMSDFVKQFNFYEYYPRKANSRANSMDAYAYIKHLQRLDDVVFTRNQLNERAGTGSSTVNYTIGMENLGLIEKDVSVGGQTSYRIRDPKVRFAIENNIEIVKP